MEKCIRWSISDISKKVCHLSYTPKYNIHGYYPHSSYFSYFIKQLISVVRILTITVYSMNITVLELRCL